MGIVVSIVLGTNALNTLYRQLAIQFPATSDPGDVVVRVRGGDRGRDRRHRSALFAGARNGLMRAARSAASSRGPSSAR